MTYMSEAPHSPHSAIRRLWRRKVPLWLVVTILFVAFLPQVFRQFRTLRPLVPKHLSARQPLGIQDLVREVKTELIAAEREMREKKEISLFELESFEMELNFMVRADYNEKMGAHTELVTAESEIQTGSEKVQKLTLHWKASNPPFSDSPSTTITDSAVIAGPKPPP